MLRGAVACVGVLIYSHNSTLSKLRECSSTQKKYNGPAENPFLFLFLKTLRRLRGGPGVPFSPVWVRCSNKLGHRALSSCSGASPTPKRRCRVQRATLPAGRVPHHPPAQSSQRPRPPNTKSPPDCAPTALFPLDGGGRHQKRGDHRNDRSTSQRSQPNRQKRNHHVKTCCQFIPRPSLFEIPKLTAANFPFSTNPSRPFCDRGFRPGDPGARSSLLPPRHVHRSPSKGWIFAWSALRPLLNNFKA